MKRLYIIAGANGSGKSTIARVLLPAEGLAYVKPDDIARELNPHDLLAVRFATGREALRRIGVLLDRGESFAIESTLSGNAYVATLVAHGNGTTAVLSQERYDAFGEGSCPK